MPPGIVAQREFVNITMHSWKIKVRRFFNDLVVRGMLYSLLIHLAALLIYLIGTYSSDYSTYDFGSESDFSSVPQTTGKTHKKLAISQAPDKVDPVKKSPEGAEKSPEQADSNAESSQDISDMENATDLSFHPNATSPHMMGSMKQYYPELARQLNVEAAVYVSIVINRTGKVIRVKVSGVTLSQKLPADREADLKKQFAAAITRSLKEVRFSPPFIDGKNIPIEMDQVVRYTLK